MNTPVIYLQHHEIDKQQWDKSISSCTNGLIYAQSWYLDLVSPNWDALISDDYHFLMPLTWKKKYGIYYLFQPKFIQQLGLFSSEANISPEILQEFFSSIPDKFRYCDLYINHKNLLPGNILPDFRFQKRITHHLDLNKSHNSIRKGYSENLSRNIKRAIKNELTIDNKVSINEVIALFKKNKGKEVQSYGKNEYLLLEQLTTEANKRNLTSLLGIRKNNNLIAASLFLTSNNEYIFIFSATNEEGKKTGAMSFLIDQFIEGHQEENKVLDFEGSMDKNLSRFYKSFGATEVVYLHIQQNRLPKIAKWLKK
jgi:hypothetical protein